jgi:hypothetical protein
MPRWRLGARIGKVIIRPLDVFDTDRPDENTWLFRDGESAAHQQRESTIVDRLLFREGDVYQGRLLEETRSACCATPAI